MANHYFQFKQFTVQQEHCAMKVCTDACLFGAWVAAQIKKDSLVATNESILDIGTGTGLLSLMLAQQIITTIDAIEIDAAAAKQAAENFNAASFKPNIQVMHANAKEWSAEKKYAFIISNPPFFENDLMSGNTKKNLALHSTELTLENLVNIIANNLTITGSFALLIPYFRKDYLIALALKNGFHLLRDLSVKQTPKHAFFRSCLVFGRTIKTPLFEEIIIQNNGVYTEQFSALLQPYYLAL
jgi:tRNA1Val (adenine37-N6)-methyltransferase